PEMIAIIEKLVANGLAYEIDGAVYFAVKRFPGYGKLSGNVGEALKQGVRGELDPAKRDPVDFALWKKAEPGRALAWPSPWGAGFPGWHIECSAMSTKYLGERFDLHTGGVDNIFPHHEDEIAQSEGAFGHPSVRHWVHGQHLLADGVKMAKSARNTMTVDEMIELEIDPLAFRYQALLTHYRARLDVFLAADKVLGLDLAPVASEHAMAPREVMASFEEHLAARATRDYQRADGLRGTFDGYRVEDQTADRALVSRADRRIPARSRRTISSGKDLPDNRHAPEARPWSVAIVTRDYPAALARCLAGVLRFLPRDGEVLVLDSGSGALAQERLARL